MTILGVIRLFASLLSLAILAVAAYLLWSWRQGDLVRDIYGVLHRERETWRLWTGAALLVWSFMGRSIALPLLARGGKRRTSTQHGQGSMLASPTGSSLFVETHGPAGAPAIVFTHGWGMDCTFWDYARQDLSDRFRLVLWDLPGLGRSRPANQAAISLSAFAVDLGAVIEASGAGQVVLVGHSIGGMTIQTLIRDHPQLRSRIAGVALLNTTYRNPLQTMLLGGLFLALQRPVVEPMIRLTMLLSPLVWLSKWQSYLSGSAHLAQRFGFGKFVTRSQLEHTTLLSARSSPRVLGRGDLAMLHWDATGVLARLRRPVLVIGGDKDIVTKLEASRTLAAETELASLEVVKGVNHMGPMERADLYNQMIADFTLRVQPGASSDLRQPGDGLDGVGASLENRPSFGAPPSAY